MPQTVNETKKVYIKTFGCQMNERDSEGVRGILTQRGYDFTEAMDNAEVILLNTCSVRQHAEDKVFGRAGILSNIKKARPETVIGIMGCMAQEHGSKFFRLIPSLDLVCGPGNIADIPEILDRVFDKRERVTAIDKINALEYTMDHIDYRSHPVRASVNIMSGCDHKCTYCIVPMTRGIERSRPSRDIVEEIKRLVGSGHRDIMLLGQNVNCYGKKLDENVDFSDLLYLIDKEAKPERIRFTTSHPKDANVKLFETMRDCKSVCEHLHLPVQSGSSRILKRMKREHTREWYLERIAEYRSILPAGTLTTDLIAGFCGETDQDFEDTKRLMVEASYDSAFIFKYSERPGTPASKLPDDVPEELKGERLQELLELQRAMTFEKNSKLIGTEHEVLFEEHDLSESTKAMGRTRHFKRVILHSNEPLSGQLRRVRVTQALNESLLGELIA